MIVVKYSEASVNDEERDIMNAFMMSGRERGTETENREQEMYVSAILFLEDVICDRLVGL